MARSNGVVKENGHAVTPANGSAGVSKVKKMEDDVYEEENIFMFIPNLIGMALAALRYS
jgi:hypothetical protein